MPVTNQLRAFLMKSRYNFKIDLMPPATNTS